MIGHCRQVEIVNALGLHLRAAEKFVHLALQFQTDVQVHHGSKTVDGKSILDLATLAAECGTRLELEASGQDAESALQALSGLVAARFGETDDCTGGNASGL
jgi:phosphocarrier protein HPr